MHKLIILCALIATCAQGRPDTRGIFEDADSLLDDFRLTVQTMLDEINAKYAETDAYIRETGQAISNIATRILTRAREDFLNQLAELDKLAQAQGLDPMSCTYGAKRDISQRYFELISSVDRCINGIIRESDENLRQAFSDFDHLNDTVLEYEVKIDECRSNNDEICALIVAAQLALHNDLLPIVLEGDIEQIVIQYSNMEPYFQSCSTVPTDEMYAAAHIIVQVAAGCLDNLLNSGS